MIPALQVRYVGLFLLSTVEKLESCVVFFVCVTSSSRGGGGNWHIKEEIDYNTKKHLKAIAVMVGAVKEVGGYENDAEHM